MKQSKIKAVIFDFDGVLLESEKAVIKTAKKLGVNPKLVVGIEDTEPGFKSVKAAGMKLIAMKAKHNAHYNFSSTDFTVTDMREIPKILEAII